jgi:hypothetical protein
MWRASRRWQCLLGWLGLCLTATALAGAGHRTEGEYQVHYAVIPTTELSPDVADTYGLVRARDRALMNIAVTRDVDGDPSSVHGVPVRIEGRRSNLLQSHPMTFREVREGNAVYYLSTFRFQHRERWFIDLVLHIDGKPHPIELHLEELLEVEE